MKELKDYELTELIKLREYFSDRLNDVVIPVGVNEDNDSLVELLDENIRHIDKFIVNTFQVLKFETRMPVFYTEESYQESIEEIKNNF